jgi:hypothetical protein
VTVPGPTTTVTTPARTTTVTVTGTVPTACGTSKLTLTTAAVSDRTLSAGARRCTLRVVAGVAVTTSRSAHVDVVASAPSTIAEDSAHTDAGRPVAFVLCLNARGRQLVRALGQRFQSLAATLTIHAESGAQSASATVPAIFRRP